MFNTNIPFGNHLPPFFSKNNYRPRSFNKNNFSNNYNYTDSFNKQQFFHPPYSNSYRPENKCSSNVQQERTKATNIQKQDTDGVLFEIFGLKIYFDDVLLVCILLFLYEEGIRDNCLFIALILLLLS